MNKITQLNEDLNKIIRDFGCNYLSLIGICSDFVQYEYSVQQINEGFVNLTRMGCLVNCGVSKPNEVMNYFFKLAGSDKMGYQVGSDQGYWLAIPPKNQITHATVLRWQTPYIAYGGEHYMQGDATGNLVFDPMQGTLQTIKQLGFLRYQVV